MCDFEGVNEKGRREAEEEGGYRSKNKNPIYQYGKKILLVLK